MLSGEMQALSKQKRRKSREGRETSFRERDANKNKKRESSAMVQEKGREEQGMMEAVKRRE